MSQLVVRPGRNAAREAKRLKDIRKVKAAIQWHERERKKRQEIAQERWETTNYHLRRIKADNDRITLVRRKALENAKEDWRLGPLRPNRAGTEDAGKYGARTKEHLSANTILMRQQKYKNEQREKKGLELESPLIVDDKRYFHIVKDDRVVVLKGKARNQIGVVTDIFERTNEAVVKGLNKQYYDSNVFKVVEDGRNPVQEMEVPIPLDDLRLVIPAEFSQRDSLNEEETKVYRDVIVDKIVMERHTTGIDPFTGTDYGDAEIPKEHQFDPDTGLPILHRYIAGTRHRIEWPWERERVVDDDGFTIGNLPERHSWLKKAMGTIRHPIVGLQRWRNKGKQTGPTEVKRRRNLAEQLEHAEQQRLKKLKTERPQNPEDHRRPVHEFTDTTRDVVEGLQSMSYTLLYPPFPKELKEELRENTHDLVVQARKDPDMPVSGKKVKRTTRIGEIAREEFRERKKAAEKMKTPMQLRWETEHAKKVQQRKKNPLVANDALLLALGQHMLKNGVKVPQSKMEEVD